MDFSKHDENHDWVGISVCCGGCVASLDLRGKQHATHLITH